MKCYVYQWSFLVPLIGGRYHIIPQLAIYIPLIYIAYWVILYHQAHLLREPETAIDYTGWCSALIVLQICSSFSSEIGHPVAHLLIPKHRPNYTLGTWEYHKIATELKSNKSRQKKILKGSLCAPFLYRSNVLFEKKPYNRSLT